MPRPAVDSLLAAIRRAELEGLRPTDYHVRALASRLSSIRHELGRGTPPHPTDIGDLDLLATDAYLTYATHLLAGAIDPVSLDQVWIGDPKEGDLPAHLQDALARDRIQRSIRDLFFDAHPGYFRLRSALARYRSVVAAGGWPAVPDADTLRPGERNEAVRLLRGRLAASGDLAVAAESPKAGSDRQELYDEPLERAVRRFQHRHGLQEDGVVGPATYRALNVPAAERVRQLELNMERWRWMPQDLGRRYVLVNIAAFRVEVIEGVRRVLRMRSIVGRQYRETPVFSDSITYLVLNPSWHVPPNLAVSDKLPLFREDPELIRRHGYRVFVGPGADAPEVDPDTVDWSAMTPGRFRQLRLWQAPGPHNALGRVKFMFPNRFNVYLHDTPERALFGRLTRDFSSGCIRVEQPLELATYLLRESESWSAERIRQTLEVGRETSVPLPDPVPIHIQYWTAWTEADGEVHFRDDVYGRDRELRRALGEAARGIPSGRFR